MEAKHNAGGTTSNPLRQHSFWKGIWVVQAPHKIKLFMWRACNSILPIKTNLLRKGVLPSCSCPICHEEVETEMHVFWDSEYKKAVWQASPFSSLWMKHRGGSWSDLVEVVLKEMASPDIELFFTIAWKIWGSRNECWLHKPHTDAASLGAQALAYTEEFLEANQKQKSALPTSTKSWIPPMDSFVNMNVAWKFQKSMKSYGMGAIIWDHNGALMATFNRDIPLSGDGLKMAAQSLLRALEFGQEAGFHRIVVEFPHTQLHALLNSRTNCLKKFQDVLEQIKSFHSIFSHLSFNVIPKICNKATSLLAGSTKVNADSSIWFEEGLAFILPIVLAELS